MSETTLERPRRILGLYRYGPVLRTPHVRRIVAGNLLALTGEAGGAIAMLLAARSAYASFGTAGTIVGASAIAVATTRVLQGRLMDRLGVRAVLVPLAGLQLAVLGAFAVAISARAAVPLVIALGVLFGMLTPAITTAMRTLWAGLLPDPEVRAVAYAFDSTSAELALMGAPALAAVLVTAVSPDAGLLTTGAFTAVGTLVVAGSRPAREHAPVASVHVDVLAFLRPLAAPTAIGFAVALAFGGLDVAIPAFATAHGAPSLAGALLAVWAAGSLVGGLWFGTRRRRRSSEMRLFACLAAVTLACAPLALAHSALALGMLLVAAGLPMAPAITTLFVLVDERAPRGRTTEAFGWVGSAIPAGAACGMALGGWIVAGLGVSAAFVTATLLSALGVVLAGLAARRQLAAASAA